MARTKKGVSQSVLRADLIDQYDDLAVATRMIARALRRHGIVPNHVEHGLSPKHDRRRLVTL